MIKMNKNKILLLMLGTILVGAGIPATFSIGTGQHQFQQINPDNPDAFCMKCHTQDTISMELMASDSGLYNGGGKIHNTLSCVECHAITSGYGASSGSKTEHAARIPQCLECHNVDTLGLVIGNVQDELSAASEAHNALDIDDSTACIGCHTGVSITGQISYSYSKGRSMKGIKIGD